MQTICLFRASGPVLSQTQEATPNIAGQDELLPEVAGCAWQQPHGNVEEWRGFHSSSRAQYVQSEPSGQWVALTNERINSH